MGTGYDSQRTNSELIPIMSGPRKPLFPPSAQDALPIARWGGSLSLRSPRRWQLLTTELLHACHHITLFDFLTSLSVPKIISFICTFFDWTSSRGCVCAIPCCISKICHWVWHMKRQSLNKQRRNTAQTTKGDALWCSTGHKRSLLSVKRLSGDR